MPSLCEMSSTTLIMETSNLTNKVLAYKELKIFDMNDAIDWAVDMLTLGYETPSLIILAGISKPTSYYEAEEYLTKSLKELNINVPASEEAVIKYCTYYIEKIAKGENVKENLYHIYNTFNILEDDNSIFKFTLLYWTWADFDYGEKYSHYWENAEISNIESIVISEAKEWLSS